MFRGFYTLSLDSKGRLSVPTKVREQFAEQEQQEFILTLDVENNLLLYTLSEWEITEKKLIKLSSLHKTSRMIKRRLMAYSTDVSIDNAGRLLIPSELRQKTQIDKKVVFIGMGNKFEIWAQERWDEVTEEDTQALLEQGVDLEGELELLSL